MTIKTEIEEEIDGWSNMCCCISGFSFFIFGFLIAIIVYQTVPVGFIGWLPKISWDNWSKTYDFNWTRKKSMASLPVYLKVGDTVDINLIVDNSK